MTNNLPTQIENLKQIITSTQVNFTELAQVHGAVTFQREASYAIQILKDNDYLAGVASSNPDSLKYAVLNIASMGLSLNPISPEVYLVPRKVGGRFKVMADIGWRGFVKKGVEGESIVWAMADIVYSADTFEAPQASKAPVHKFDPFAPIEKRGNPVGAYCVARVHNGDFMTVMMAMDEIQAIAESSEAFKKKAGPWFTHWSEMVKKTVIRRAAKAWPPAKTEALKRALEIDAETNPVAITAPPKSEDVRSHSFDAIRETLKKINRDEEALIKHLSRMFNREIKALENLTDIEINKTQGFLAALPKQVAK